MADRWTICALVEQLGRFLDHRGVVGWVLLVTMLFFSSLAFTVLENAMSVIFLHRVVSRRRHFLVSTNAEEERHGDGAGV